MEVTERQGMLKSSSGCGCRVSLTCSTRDTSVWQFNDTLVTRATRLFLRLVHFRHSLGTHLGERRQKVPLSRVSPSDRGKRIFHLMYLSWKTRNHWRPPRRRPRRRLATHGWCLSPCNPTRTLYGFLAFAYVRVRLPWGVHVPVRMRFSSTGTRTQLSTHTFLRGSCCPTPTADTLEIINSRLSGSEVATCVERVSMLKRCEMTER